MLEKLTKGCLTCMNPKCKEGCPINNRIPEIIKALKIDDLDKALNLLYEENPIPIITGLFCNGYCNQNCILNIKNTPYNFNILEKELSNTPIKINIDDSLKNKKIAIVGAGPIGLSQAILFSRHGASPVIFEKSDHTLPIIKDVFPITKVSENEIKKIDEYIGSFNFDIRYNSELGKDIFLNDLLKEYDYCILSIGKGTSRKSNIDGASNVLSAIDFLKKSHEENFLKSIPENVCLYGLGNVSIDIAILLKSLNKNVEIYYHKPLSLSRLSAHDKLKINKYNLNVIFDTRIVKVDGLNITFENNGNTYIKSNFYPIFAIGQLIDYNFLNNSNIETDFSDFKNIYTSIDNLYIAGDLSSTRSDISTGIKTAKDIINDILDKNRC